MSLSEAEVVIISLLAAEAIPAATCDGRVRVDWSQ